MMSAQLQRIEDRKLVLLPCLVWDGAFLAVASLSSLAISRRNVELGDYWVAK